MDEVIWNTQQMDDRIQQLYQSIMESGGIIIKATSKLTILEDKVFSVVKHTFKTIYQAYIPTSLRPQLLKLFHEDPMAGHLGRFKTFKRLQSLAYWPNLNLDVKQHVQACQVCQCYKPESR